MISLKRQTCLWALENSSCFGDVECQGQIAMTQTAPAHKENNSLCRVLPIVSDRKQNSSGLRKVVVFCLSVFFFLKKKDGNFLTHKTENSRCGKLILSTSLFLHRFPSVSSLVDITSEGERQEHPVQVAIAILEKN